MKEQQKKIPRSKMYDGKRPDPIDFWRISEAVLQLEYCFHFSGIFDVFLSDTVTFSHLSCRILRDSVTGTFDLDCHSPNQTVFVNEKECIRFYLSSLFEIKKSELEIRSLQAPSFQRIQASICVLAVFHHHEPTQRG